MFITDWVKKRARSDQYGNLAFWISFCIIGQPTALMLYYHDWVLVNRPEWVEQVTAAAATIASRAAPQLTA